MIMLDKVIDFIFPRGYKCILCGEELDHSTLYSICDSCLNSLPYNNGHNCLRCDRPLNNMGNYCTHCKNNKLYFKRNRSLFLYKKPINTIVRKLKYDNKRYLSETFSNMIAGEVSRMGQNFDIVIPVPLYFKRLKKRGYNQSELLCESLKTKLNMNVNSTLLLKVRNTLPQANLTRSERVENLNDAFMVRDKKAVKGKTILLVDDVFTTGTTINECAKTLVEAGAKEVYSITLAHAYFVNKDNNKD